jgi:hypothetical protein
MNITPENVFQCEEVLKELQNRVEELGQMTRHYPLEITFADCRFVFANKTEIVNFISALDDKISAYKSWKKYTREKI